MRHLVVLGIGLLAACRMNFDPLVDDEGWTDTSEVPDAASGARHHVCDPGTLCAVDCRDAESCVVDCAEASLCQVACSDTQCVVLNCVSLGCAVDCGDDVTLRQNGTATCGGG